MASATTPCGYWLVGTDGGIFNFGDAAVLRIYRVPAPPAARRGHLDGGQGLGASGYWLVASDGGIFAFNTGFYGSIPGLGLQPCGARGSRTA